MTRFSHAHKLKVYRLQRLWCGDVKRFFLRLVAFFSCIVPEAFLLELWDSMIEQIISLIRMRTSWERTVRTCQNRRGRKNMQKNVMWAIFNQPRHVEAMCKLETIHLPVWFMHFKSDYSNPLSSDCKYLIGQPRPYWQSSATCRSFHLHREDPTQNKNKNQPCPILTGHMEAIIS